MNPPADIKAPDESESAQHHVWAKVAHISDLHFGRGFDSIGWSQLVDFLKRERPKVLIVSGDVVNSPWPLMLALARNELRELARLCGSELLVVPGNHDVAVLGNVKIPLLTHFFAIAFAASGKPADGAQFLDAVPSYTAFSGLPRLRRWSTRALLWARLWPGFLWRAVGHSAARVTSKSNEFVRVLLIDSNPALRLASGRITTRTVGEIERSVSELLGNDLQPVLPRIAVLHHHPVAIAGSENRETATSFEPFLALRNGGTLLRLLGRSHFDLVLHGHRHFAGVTRVSHDLRGEDGGGVVVVAAASAGVNTDSASSKTIGMIEIERSGRLRVDLVNWGRQNPPRRSPRAGTPLQSIHEFKRRAYLRAVQAQGIRCREVHRQIAIDEFGVSEIWHQLRGIVGVDREVSELVFWFSTSIGRIQTKDIQLVRCDPPSRDFQPENESKPGQEPSRRVRVRVPFDTPIPAKEAKEGEISISYVTHNAFWLSEWEAQQHTRKQGPAEDYAGVRISVPTERLVVDLKLPKSTLAPATPQIRCVFPAGYPRVSVNKRTGQLDPVNAVAPAAGQATSTWTDPDFSEVERPSLEQLPDGTWRFTVDHPLIGATYRVYWPVKAPREVGQSSRAPVLGQTKALRKIFIDHALQSRQSSAARTGMQKLLEEFRVFLQGVYRPRHTSVEKCALTLHVYDESRASLIVVETVRNWGAPPSWDFAIPLGDGIAGSCFKQGRPIVFVDPSLKPQGATKGWTLLNSGGPAASPAYQALLTLPLFCPGLGLSGGPDPEATVGVISFGTDAPDSGLVELDSGKSNRPEQLESIVKAAQVLMLALSRSVDHGKTQAGQ